MGQAPTAAQAANAAAALHGYVMGAPATTAGQALGIEDSYSSSRWNGIDPALTGTAVGHDFVLVRVNGTRPVTSYKNGYYADGAFDALCETFAQSADKYDAEGVKLPLYNEYAGAGGNLVDAARLYGLPVTKSNSALGAGKSLLDVGLFTGAWPLQWLNKQWGDNAQVDNIVAPGLHALTDVGVLDPNFGGFPQQITYGNWLHDNVFWLKDFAPALLRLSGDTALMASAPPPGSPISGYSTYGAAVGEDAAKMLGVCHWLLYGGAPGYAGNAPVSDGGGGYAGGPLKAACDGYEVGLTHRLWTTASALQSVFLLCRKIGIPDSEDLLWWSRQYALQAVTAQVWTTPRNTLGQPGIGLTGYYPEYAARDGVGFDVSYGATSLRYAVTYYLECPDRALADGVILPSIRLAAAAYASRVAPDGTINLWGDTRCNPLGLPATRSGGANVYAGESNQDGTTKQMAYDMLADAFLQIGAIQTALTGSDAPGYALLGARIALKASYDYIAPDAAATP